MSTARDPQFATEWEIFDSLVADVHRLVGDSATVDVGYLHAGRIGYCDVEPRNPRARSIYVMAQEALQVTIGNVGGRWELDYSDEGVSIARRLIEAAVAGRVRERSALGRSRVIVTYSNGDEDWETGYAGCAGLLIPQPGWKRWGDLTTYEPYVVGTEPSSPG